MNTFQRARLFSSHIPEGTTIPVDLESACDSARHGRAGSRDCLRSPALTVLPRRLI